MQNSIWEKMKKMMEEHPVSHVRRLKKPIAMVCIVALAAANLQVNSAVTVTNAAETAVEESTGSDARETENAEEHTKPAEPAAEKKEEAPADSGQPAEVKEAEPEEKPAAQEEEPAASSASDEKEAEEAAGREPAEAEPAEEAAPEDASEEAAPAEETADEAEAASSAVTEAAPEEAKPAAGELTAKGRGYTVTVTFTEKAGLPEGTKLTFNTQNDEIEQLKLLGKIILGGLK